jgi:hypothetical protein
MALLPPNTASGDGGVSVHGDLTGRDLPGQHPINAIIGLQDWLNQQDRVVQATQPLRYIFGWVNVSTQTVVLPAPLDTLSLAIAVVRSDDGALIEPEIEYLYDSGAMHYLSGVKLGFTPPVTGEHRVHITR